VPDGSRGERFSIDWWKLDALARRQIVALYLIMLACLVLGILVDRPIVRLVHGLDGAPRDVVQAVSNLGQSTWWLLVSFGLFLYLRYVAVWRAMAARALFVFTAVALSGIVANLIKILVGRARPKVMFRDEPYYGLDPLSFDSAYHSFPSGHMATATALALAAWVLWPRGWPLWLAFAVAIGASRVLLGAHFPSDVVGSAYITAITVWLVRRRFVNTGAELPFAPRATPESRRSAGPARDQRVGTGTSPL